MDGEQDSTRSTLTFGRYRYQLYTIYVMLGRAVVARSQLQASQRPEISRQN